MKKANISYYPKTNKCHIGAKSIEFYPQYLKYLLQYLNVPETAELHFLDKKYKGGIQEFIQNKKGNEK